MITRLLCLVSLPLLVSCAAPPVASTARAADVWLHIEGEFPQLESLVVSLLTKDGKGGWNKTNNYHLPVCVPPGTASLELLVRPDAAVRSVALWRVARAPAAKPAAAAK